MTLQQTILLALVVLSGCQESEIKEVRSSYKNGKDEIVRYYRNKKDTLTYRKEVFYETGEREYLGNISNGKKNGLWVWWYGNGNKRDQCKYVNNLYTDTVFHWYENGNLKQLEIVNGATAEICNGTTIRYYEDGSLKEQFTNVEGRFEGLWITRDKNGSYKRRVYRNDTLNGPNIEFINSTDSSEIQIVKGQYENGKETGLWQWLNKDSVIVQTGIYKKGILTEVKTFTPHK